MDFIAKNNFIVQNASADHFDADLATFKKVFPDSPILPALSRPEAYNKKQLDERMLLELLEAKGIDVVLQGRNVAKPVAKPITKPAKDVLPEAKDKSIKQKSPKETAKKKAGHA